MSPKDVGSSHIIEGMDAVAGSPELVPWRASNDAKLSQNYLQNFEEFLEGTDEDDDETDKREQGEFRRWTRKHHDPERLLPGLDNPEGILRRGIGRSRGVIARHRTGVQEGVSIPTNLQTDLGMNMAKMLDSLGSDRKELSPSNQITDDTGETVIDLTKFGGGEIIGKLAMNSVWTHLILMTIVWRIGLIQNSTIYLYLIAPSWQVYKRAHLILRTQTHLVFSLLGGEPISI